MATCDAVCIVNVFIVGFKMTHSVHIYVQRLESWTPSQTKTLYYIIVY